MTNREWLNGLSAEKLARLISRKTNCDYCNFLKKNDKCTDSESCVKGIIEWLNAKHEKPMPEIKIGDAIYSYIDESRVMFIVVSNIHACDSHGLIVRWRELNNIWKIARINDEKEEIEEIWRADNDYL